MGEVVFWTIVRIVIVLPLVWLLKNYVSYDLWWAISIIGIYVLIVHPAVMRFRSFNEKNKEVIEDTLCSTCEHFDKSAVLCMKHDEHPTKDYLPCDGIDWSPKPSQNKNEDVFE